MQQIIEFLFAQIILSFNFTICESEMVQFVYIRFTGPNVRTSRSFFETESLYRFYSYFYFELD